MRDRTWLTTAVLLMLASTGSAAQTDSLATEAAAKSLLRHLSGEWTFHLAGVTESARAWRGSRSYRPMHDSLHLVWDEIIGDSTDVGHGLLWYDPPSRRLFYFGLYAGSRMPVSLIGHLHDGTVEFEPLALPDPPFDRNAAVVGSVLEVNGWSSHTWSRRGNGWLVQFDRADGSGP